jgi:hypothetical protein
MRLHKRVPLHPDHDSERGNHRSDYQKSDYQKSDKRVWKAHAHVLTFEVQTLNVNHARPQEKKMTASNVLLFPIKPAPPETVRQLLTRVEEDLKPIIESGSAVTYTQRKLLRTACRRIAKMLKTLIEHLLIEQIAELTGEHYVRSLGCTSRQAQALMRSQKKLLQYAASYGWTCEALCRSQAWEPFRDALLTGEPSAGALGIVEFANRRKYWPDMAAHPSAFAR